MDFDFSRFSTRSFERFAQSLAVHYLGAGIHVYGDGADGAREASYSGRLEFPTTADAWDGYCVVQAKFRQHSVDSGEDANWLVGQMHDELSKFLNPERELPKPDYYLLVTNARLSPTPKVGKRSGGIEKINAVFEDYKAKLGIRDFRIWHYDELCARLGGAEQIRRAHAAWTTPSDVLSAILEKITFSRPDFADVMHRFLQRELRSQRATRLQQAGHSGDTNLEGVFVDLPYTIEADFDDNAREGLLISDLIEMACDNLKPSIAAFDTVGQKARSDRLLILGGPGQGKSTVSQYFAQLLRARLLKIEKKRYLSVDVSRIVDSMLQNAKAIGLGTEMPLRFPIRIELPLFADALATKQNDLPLFEYIREHIASVSTQPDLTVDDLRLWLRNYPFVFLLDGLDEVPPSANRNEVINAINELWDEISSVDGDVLMLVMTRPQGYNNDLDPVIYTKMEMAKLKPDLALTYADKLAHVRLTDPAQIKRVLDRLLEAANSPTTSHLLVSPLQVAIMLALIDQRGEAPSDRWTLFDKYFNVVLEREQQKPGEGGRVVKKWSRIIGALQQSIGFKLHLHGETGGGADAYISRKDLETLVHYQLTEEGYNGDLLEKSVKELCEATTDRLVLLVHRVDQRYSFEVRSLQEYMAASYLMSGKELVVQERLREIANKNHWRHVFLIAASKCFSSNDTLHYRDTIISICRELDTNDQVDRVLRSGARLSISLLEDGLAHDQPLWRRQLLLSALQYLNTGAINGSAIDEMIDENIEHICPFLSLMLTSNIRSSRLNAWHFVLRNALNNHKWAIELSKNYWPSKFEDKLSLLALSPTPEPNSELYKLFRDTIENSAPTQINSFFENEYGPSQKYNLETLVKSFEYLSILRYMRPKRNISMKNAAGDWPMKFAFVSVQIPHDLERLYSLIPNSKAWGAIQLIAEFHRAPSAQSLASAWEKVLNNNWVDEVRNQYRITPWPLSTVIQLSEQTSFTSDDIRDGLFGDLRDWRAAEKRWTQQGVKLEDLHYISKTVPPRFNKKVGMPWPNSLSLSGDSSNATWLPDLIETARVASPSGRQLLTWIIDFALSMYRPNPLLSESDVLTIALGIGNSNTERHIPPEIIFAFSDDAKSSAEVNKALSDRASKGKIFISGKFTSDKIKEVANTIDSAQDFPGLLVLLANLFGPSKDLSTLAAIDTSSKSHITHENPHIASAAELFQLLKNAGATKIDRLLHEPRPRYGVHHLINALRRNLFDDYNGMKIGSQLALSVENNEENDHERAISELSRLADSRCSRLGEEDCRQRLALPYVLCQGPEVSPLS